MDRKSSSLYETTSTLRGCALRKYYQVLSRKFNQRKASQQGSGAAARNLFLEFSDVVGKDAEFPELTIAVDLALSLAETWSDSKGVCILFF